MLASGMYNYYKVSMDGVLVPAGEFSIQDDQLKIVSDPLKILENLFDQGPVTRRTMDVIRSINNNHYAYVIHENKDNNMKDTVGNHDPSEIDDEDKIDNPAKLDHLRNILEKEEDAEEISIPDHIVIKHSSPHWDK